MSIKILLTGSEDFGKAEIALDDEHASVGYLKSDDFSALAAEVVAQQTLLAKNLKASHGLSPEPTVVTGSGSPYDNSQPNPQFASNIPQPAQPPAWAQQQPSNVVPIQQGPEQHPQSMSCHCGKVLIHEPKFPKPHWKCPEYRGVKDAGGRFIKGGNGHRVEWTP